MVVWRVAPLSDGWFGFGKVGGIKKKWAGGTGNTMIFSTKKKSGTLGFFCFFLAKSQIFFVGCSVRFVSFGFLSCVLLALIGLYAKRQVIARSGRRIESRNLLVLNAL